MSEQAKKLLVSLCAAGKVPGVLAKMTAPATRDLDRALDGWEKLRMSLVTSDLARALERGDIVNGSESSETQATLNRRFLADLAIYGPLVHHLLLDFANNACCPTSDQRKEFMSQVLDQFQEESFHRRAVELESKE